MTLPPTSDAAATWTHERLARDLDGALPGAALLLRAALPGTSGALAETRRVACERVLAQLSSAVTRSSARRQRLAILGAMAALSTDGYLWGRVHVLWELVRAAALMRPVDDAPAVVLLAGIGWSRGANGEPLPIRAALGLDPGATAEEQAELVLVLSAGNWPELVLSPDWWEVVPRATVATLVEITAEMVDRLASPVPGALVTPSPTPLGGQSIHYDVEVGWDEEGFFRIGGKRPTNRRGKPLTNQVEAQRLVDVRDGKPVTFKRADASKIDVVVRSVLRGSPKLFRIRVDAPEGKPGRPRVQAVQKGVTVRLVAPKPAI